MRSTFSWLPRLLAFAFVLINMCCSAQTLSYAKEVIGKLTSDEMKGRGYVGNGDKIAAEYIASEFEKAGVKKFNESFFQEFTTPVNSFPGKMQLKINGKPIVPGKDFLVEPGAPGIKGKFKIEYLPIEDLLDKDNAWLKKMLKAKGKFIAVASYDKKKLTSDQQKQLNNIINVLKYGKENPAVGVLVITDEKLTWSGSTELLSKPSFTINSNVIQLPVSDVEVNVENEFIRKHATQNVVGYIPGERTDSLLVFTAHYDHLGMMGSETIFPGANDNASGVSVLLNLVKHYSTTKPPFSVAFIAFAAEEIGLVGSRYFVENPVFPLSKIKFLINFDLAGTGDDGIQVVNGKVYESVFKKLNEINKQQNLMNQIKVRGEACNSDHCMFHAKGVPCFYIYTLGGIQAYHDIYDRGETLPLTDYEDYVKLIIGLVDTL